MALAGPPWNSRERPGLPDWRPLALPRSRHQLPALPALGPLRWLWWPYRKALRHRSVLSHSPLLGTLVRVGYLTGLALLLTGLAHPPAGMDLLRWLQQQWSRPERLLLVALIGIEASAWLHLLQDGDPMPRMGRRR